MADNTCIEQLEILNMMENLSEKIALKRVDPTVIETLTNALEDLIATGLITVSEDTFISKAKLPVHLNVSSELKIYPNAESLLVNYGEAQVIEQVNLETEYVEQAVTQYRNAKNNLYNRKVDACVLRPEQIMFSRCIEPLANAISAYTNRYGVHGYKSQVSIANIMNQIDPYQGAVVITKAIINTVLRRKVIAVQLVNIISNAYKEAIELERFRQLKPNLIKRIEFETRLYGASFRHVALKENVKNYLHPQAWDHMIKVRFGAVCLQMFMQATGLLKFETKFDKRTKKKTRYVLTSGRVLDSIGKSHGMCELFKPTLPPMLIKPLEWTSLKLGGYVTNFYTRRLTLVKPMRYEHLDWIEEHFNTNLYITMNHLQSTPYAINKRVLDEFKHVLNSGGDCAGIPNMQKDKYLPVKPYTREHKAEFKRDNPELYEQYKQQTTNALLEWNNGQCKRVMAIYKRMFAERYADRTIYFPWFFDWRGRLYPCVSYVNPQMDDIGKGLLHFADAKPITEEGINWLEVHGANCWGNDKVSFADRIKFIRENKREIFRVAQDPSYKFWHEADSPFKFLAFCFEYYDVHHKYKHAAKEHMTQLPISIDGSCNGLQHYAALLLDEVGGSCVNLVPQDQPNDVYSEVAKEVDKLVKIDAASGVKHASKFVGMISRKLVKRNVMTLVYGVTRFGMAEQLLEIVNEWKQQGIWLNYDSNYVESAYDNDRKACEYLSGVVLKAISKVNVAATECMKWLQQCARGVKGGLVWFTPSGFPVVQYYMKNETRVVNTVYGKSKLAMSSIYSQQRPVSTRKQAQSLPPNFIHSLDSAHCHKTILLCKEHNINSLAMIHDSYATHASDTTKLSNLLRQAFVEQYSTCQLTRFRDNLLQVYPGAKLPALPKKGNLDLNKVLVSPYFFA